MFLKLMTKTRICAFLAAMLGAGVLTFAGSMTSAADDLTGRQIMEMKKERHHKPVEKAETRMALIEPDGATSERTMISYSREFEDGLSKTLQVFMAPSGVHGVASLSWETESGDDDQWTFLPALGKLKRVVGGAKRSYFMGTDFANEDMVSENLQGHRYERQPDEEIDGQAVYVVDAYPETESVKKGTGYHHRRLYIRQDILVNVKVEYYERRTEKLMKTMIVEEVLQIDDMAWRPKVSLMDNHKENHKTRNTVLSYSFEENAVDPDIFEHRYIERKKHMR